MKQKFDDLSLGSIFPITIKNLSFDGFFRKCPKKTPKAAVIWYSLHLDYCPRQGSDTFWAGRRIGKRRSGCPHERSCNRAEITHSHSGRPCLALRDLLDQGVLSIGDPTQCHAVAIDGRAGIVTRLDCVVYSVVVNKYGERFYDEGEDVWPKRYAIWGRLVAKQPD